MDCHSLDFRVLLQGQWVSPSTSVLIKSALSFWKLGATGTSVKTECLFMYHLLSSHSPARKQKHATVNRIHVSHMWLTPLVPRPAPAAAPTSAETRAGWRAGERTWALQSWAAYTAAVFLEWMLLYIYLAYYLTSVWEGFNFNFFISVRDRRAFQISVYYIRTLTEHI